MKLYLSPGTSSLSPHIALLGVGLDFTAERGDIRTSKTACGLGGLVQFDEGLTK
jgi:hypothetical protein